MYRGIQNNLKPIKWFLHSQKQFSQPCNWTKKKKTFQIDCFVSSEHQANPSSLPRTCFPSPSLKWCFSFFSSEKSFLRCSLPYPCCRLAIKNAADTHTSSLAWKWGWGYTMLKISVNYLIKRHPPLYQPMLSTLCDTLALELLRFTNVVQSMGFKRSHWPNSSTQPGNLFGSIWQTQVISDEY